MLTMALTTMTTIFHLHLLLRPAAKPLITILHLLPATKPPITMLHHRSKYFKLASLAPLSCVSCGPRRFYGRISFTVANWFRLR
jgi:hypothetical protein